MQSISGKTLRTCGWKFILPAVLLCAAVAQAQTFTPLADFTNSIGGGPGSPLIQGLDGNFYGTAGDSGIGGRGAVYIATSGGTLSDLFSFCKAPTCPTGANPYLSLLQISNGDFFGFTFGTSDNGTLFKLSPTGGVINTLYTFCATTCTDGQLPRANLIQARNGDLYGTTNAGGTSDNAGTIFKLTTAGTLTTVYDFCQLTRCADGSSPIGYGSLIQATDGFFYGTTRTGGEKGFGTIYQLSSSGTLKTIYKFCKAAGCLDGSNPVGLVEGLDGNLYGVTTGGGANGYGDVFKVTRGGGGLTVLYSFCSQTGCSDGNGPTGLLLGSDGNFYGTTANLGSNGAVPNTIFQVTPSGAHTVLYSSDLNTESSVLSVMQSTDGNLYGTNSTGGANGLGTFFKLSTGLGPFVRALRPYGQIGETAYILGTGLTGSTSVTFNGTAATSFTVVSDSEITVVVPTGATTGTLQVVTPGGTLSSVVEFQVFQ
ncbi:MAG TPA: choice-of-anchor tandem repeat GloVer-containing protein [Candidatus Eremiobacteraceae bacterium]|nr:choice-of-anchor tandem repeat GloVer-containing protein [Candidatus Eremiobacteraceae bacterium]